VQGRYEKEAATEKGPVREPCGIFVGKSRFSLAHPSVFFLRRGKGEERNGGSAISGAWSSESTACSEVGSLHRKSLFAWLGSEWQVGSAEVVLCPGISLFPRVMVKLNGISKERKNTEQGRFLLGELYWRTWCTWRRAQEWGGRRHRSTGYGERCGRCCTPMTLASYRENYGRYRGGVRGSGWLCRRRRRRPSWCASRRRSNLNRRPLLRRLSSRQLDSGAPKRPSSRIWEDSPTNMATSHGRSTIESKRCGRASGDTSESSSTGREHRSDSRFAFLRRRRWRHCFMGVWHGPHETNTTDWCGRRTTGCFCELLGTAASAGPTVSSPAPRPWRGSDVRVWRRLSDSGDCRSRGLLPGSRTGHSRSGWWYGSSRGGRSRAESAPSRTWTNVLRTTSRRLWATRDSTNEEPRYFGIPKACWMEAARACEEFRDKRGWEFLLPHGTRTRRGLADNERLNETKHRGGKN